jgi:type VI secretion system protein VasI
VRSWLAPMSVSVLVLAGCVSGPAATPIIIYVTAPPPTPGLIASAPPNKPSPSDTPTRAATLTPRPTPTPPNTGRWRIAPTERDPISDKPTANITLSSTTGRSQFDDPITLVIRCKDDEMDLYINWHQFVNNDSQEVELRLGNGTPVTRSWSNSTDYEATFYPSDPTQQIKNMFGSTTLVARTTPYSSNTITATWDITGIENAIANVRDACGW